MAVKKTQRRKSYHRTQRRKTYRKKRVNTKRNKVRRKQKTYKKLKRGGSGRTGSRRTGSRSTGSRRTGSRRTGSRSTEEPISPLAVAFKEVCDASKAGDSSLIVPRRAWDVEKKKKKKKKKKKEDEDRVPDLVPRPAPPPQELVESAMNLADACQYACQGERPGPVQLSKPEQADPSAEEVERAEAQFWERVRKEGSKMRAQHEAKSAAETKAQRQARRKAGDAESEGSTGCCGFVTSRTKVKQDRAEAAKQKFAERVTDVRTEGEVVNAFKTHVNQ